MVLLLWQRNLLRTKIPHDMVCTRVCVVLFQEVLDGMDKKRGGMKLVEKSLFEEFG